MAKITRLPGNHIPFASNATNSKRRTFGTNTSADDLASNLNADYRRGWEATAGGVNDKPTIQDFNALGYTQGQLIAYLMQQGVPEWDNAQEYYSGSVATFNNVLYIAQAPRQGVSPNTGSRWINISDPTTWASIQGTLPVNKLPNHSGNKITSGIVREPYIDGLIARRQAVTTEIAAALSGITNDYAIVTAYAGNSTGSSGLSLSSTSGSGSARRYTEPSKGSRSYIGKAVIERGAAVPRLGSAYQWTLMEELGQGQTWRDVTSSRGVRVTYTNNYGRTIAVIAGRNNLSVWQISGLTIGNNSDGNADGAITMIVPEGGTYRPRYTTSTRVYELR